MERNLQVEPELRRALNGFMSASSSAGVSVCQMPAADCSDADVKDEAYRLPQSEEEIAAAEARVLRWRSNPNLPALGAQVKLPAGPYEVFHD